MVTNASRALQARSQILWNFWTVLMSTDFVCNDLPLTTTPKSWPESLWSNLLVSSHSLCRYQPNHLSWHRSVMATVLLDVDFTNKQNIVHCSFTSTSSVKYVTGVHEMISFVWYPTSPCSLIIIIIIMLLRIKKYQRDNFIPNYDEYYYICAFEFSQRM